MVDARIDNSEQAVMQFIAREAVRGRLESTIPEIVDGAKLGRLEAVKALERLTVKGLISVRTRGTDRKSTGYYCLAKLSEFAAGLAHDLSTRAPAPKRGRHSKGT